MRIFQAFLFVGLLVSCSPVQQKVDPSLTLSKAERERRIALDFTKEEKEVTAYIRQYIPDFTPAQQEKWERTQALEHRWIKGKKRYFRNAAPNLFRIDSFAKSCKEKRYPAVVSQATLVDQTHVPQVIQHVLKTDSIYVEPVRMRLTYTLSVHPNVVPDGTTIRCWLPYPRRDEPRQRNIQLLSLNGPSIQIANKEATHSTLYTEKKAVKDSATVFKEVLEFTSYAEWHPLTPKEIQPYRRSTALYKKYTAQRAPHLVFTPAIKRLSQQIVGTEKNPLKQVYLLFKWISDTFPWASAREYSTLTDIPSYVLANKHGDCGQVSLLFIDLARCLGIPADFQSGLMLHPGDTNIHDWVRVYFEGVGWVPVDPSFGIFTTGKNQQETYFFAHGIDAYRMIVNNGYGDQLYPPKNYSRSETVDFQRGEVEWEGGNLYFNQWSWNIDVAYIPLDN